MTTSFKIKNVNIHALDRRGWIHQRILLPESGENLLLSVYFKILHSGEERTTVFLIFVIFIVVGMLVEYPKIKNIKYVTSKKE